MLVIYKYIIVLIFLFFSHIIDGSDVKWFTYVSNL